MALVTVELFDSCPEYVTKINTSPKVKVSWYFTAFFLSVNFLSPLQCLRLRMPIANQRPGYNMSASWNTSKQVASNTTDLLNDLLKGYDSRLRPGFGGPPTIVDVNLNIRSMGPISEKEMAYQMDCYFRQSWVDQRLRFTGPMKILVVSVQILDRIWKPDTHFLNGQRSYLHVVTTPNKLLRIHQNGRILYSMRLTIKASCPMHLENFPMDTQMCPLRFGSHGYDTSDLKYIWTHGVLRSIEMAEGMRLSQFDLIGYPAGNDSAFHAKGVWRRGSRGDILQHFSTLFVVFKLRRHMGYFMINVYVPCTLLTVISWVGFWINREATADRIALGIMTVLTMCFLGIDTRNDLPKVSYSTALDYFVIVCFIFVLATVLEFAWVHFFTKYGSGEIYHDADSEMSDDEDYGDGVEENDTSSAYETFIIERGETGPLNGEATFMLDEDESFATANTSCTNTSTNHTTITTTTTTTTTTTGSRRFMKDSQDDPSHHSCCTKILNCILGNAIYRRNQPRPRGAGYNSVSSIDKASRVLFPSTFLVFNIVYWTCYLKDYDHV